jgi:hypothetical protein
MSNNMDTKQVIAVGKLYRGVMINEDGRGFVILGEAGQRYEFASEREAQRFVDAWYAMQLFGDRVTP